MAQSRVDVIIVNWNAGRLLFECVDSLGIVGDELGRVVVVDNASSDDSVTPLAPLAARLPLEIVRNRANKGFAAACNQGAAGSAADFLLFLNPDTRLNAKALTEPLGFFASAEAQSVGIAGIALVDAVGEVSRSCGRFPSAAAMIGQSFGLDRLLPSWCPPAFLCEWPHDSTRIVDQVMGAFYMIRRRLFESLGGFDERFFVYYEDLDLALRARKLGWASAYVATAQAFHQRHGTTEAIKATRLFYFLRSRIFFALKHFTRPEALAVAATTLLVEPLTRSVSALLSGRVGELAEIVGGYAMLWRDLPNMRRQWRQRDEGHA